MWAARNHARISPAAPRPALHETFIYLTVGNVKNSPVGFHTESGTDHLGFFRKQLVPFAWMRSLTGGGWAAPPWGGVHKCNSTTAGGPRSSRWVGCAPKTVARVQPWGGIRRKLTPPLPSPPL